MIPWTIARQLYESVSVIAGLVTNQFAGWETTPSDSDIKVCIHQLWKSLCSGDTSESKKHNRPALPVELVMMVFQHVNCYVILSSLTSTSTPRREYGVQSMGPLSTFKWLITPPLTSDMLHILRRHTTSLELDIESKDQGFVSSKSASYSWFEIALYSSERFEPRDTAGGLVPDQEPRTVIDDKGKTQTLSWRFRDNELAGMDWKREISVIEATHEIWNYVEVGDQLCVRMCAQYPSWSNKARDGEMRFRQDFEPSRAPLDDPDTEVCMGNQSRILEEPVRPVDWYSSS